MTEEQNKQARPAPLTKSENKPAATTARPSATKNETTGAKKHPPSKKAPDKPGANATETRKSVGQYIRDQRRSRLFAFISVLALLVGLSALAADYWLRQQDLHGDQQRLQIQTQLQQRIEELGRRQEQAERNGQNQRHELQQSLSGQLNDQLARLEKQQETVIEPDWLLAEAEYLIRIADHRLQLVGDVDTAISALMLADQRLFALRDPRVTAARRQLNNDINRLRSLPRIDTVGVALTLSALQQQVSTLPLNQMTGNNTESGDEKQSVADSKPGLLDSIIASLKGLVSIRRVDDKATAIVPPEQRGFLFQNLALKLEAARFALLSGDDTLYHQSLASIQAWLTRYFDQQSSSVQAMLVSLQKIDDIKLDPVLPDLATSLQAVQAVISQRQKSAQRDDAASPDNARQSTQTDNKTIEKAQENPAARSDAVTDDQDAGQ